MVCSARFLFSFGRGECSATVRCVFVGGMQAGIVGNATWCVFGIIVTASQLFVVCHARRVCPLNSPNPYQQVISVRRTFCRLPRASCSLVRPQASAKKKTRVALITKSCDRVVMYIEPERNEMRSKAKEVSGSCFAHLRACRHRWMGLGASNIVCCCSIV